MAKLTRTLGDVPQTMLMTLYNRAMERDQLNPIIVDPEASRILDNIGEDLSKVFGPPNDSHATRSLRFDQIIRSWAKDNPGGRVVNLAEGLETQRYRLSDLDLDWYAVDLPEVIEVRDRFIKPDARHHHIAGSVTDDGFLETIPPGKAVITAQGLVMWLQPEDIRPLLARLAKHFPGGTFAFDGLPEFIARVFNKNRYKTGLPFVMPEVPFAANVAQMKAITEEAVPGTRFETVPWGFARGFKAPMMKMVEALPVLKTYRAAIYKLVFPE